MTAEKTTVRREMQGRQACLPLCYIVAMSVRFALRRHSQWAGAPRLFAVLLIVALSLATLYGAIMLAGTKLGMLLALLALFGPVSVYLALTSPLLFPFCLYVLLVPFDNLLDLSSFGTLTKLLGAACGVALLVWLARSRAAMAPGRAVLVWAVFVVLCVASVMWAIDPALALGPLFTTVELFALYAIIACMPVDAKTLTAVLWTVIASGGLAACYGIYLLHTGGDMSHGRLFIAVAGANGNSSHIDPNHFAASLLMPIGLATVTLVQARSWSPRAAAFACLVLMAYGVAFAGSRGALLALVAMVLYLMIRSPKRWLIAGAALAGFGAALAYHSSAISRFSMALSTGGAGRLEIWKVGWAAFRLQPVLGAGLGNFGLAYNRAFLDVSLTKNIYWNQAPHSNLVWIAVELGCVGLVIFLYAWWVQFRSLRSIDRDDAFFPLRTALEAGLIGLFVASLFLGTLTYKYLWLGFILVMLTRNAWVLTRKRIEV